MSKAQKPSKVTLPHAQSHSTVLNFLCEQFPHVPAEQWQKRLQDQQVHWKNGAVISEDTPYQPGKTLFYYRQVEQEPQIPFDETIIEHNEHFLAVHKPHFLPVMPTGVFVNECLQARLIRRTGNPDLQAVHRLDRDTAGLVLFSTNPKTRNQYHQLFASKHIAKQYQAVAKVPHDKVLEQQSWHIKNYQMNSTPKFLFKNLNTEEPPPQAKYAESIIECQKQHNDLALFSLQPITGRTHQLRLHMMEIGYPILNDRFYPELQPKQADNYQKPLQLLASSLRFTDPVSGQEISLISPHTLEI